MITFVFFLKINVLLFIVVKRVIYHVICFRSVHPYWILFLPLQHRNAAQGVHRPGAGEEGSVPDIDTHRTDLQQDGAGLQGNLQDIWLEGDGHIIQGWRYMWLRIRRY